MPDVTSSLATLGSNGWEVNDGAGDAWEGGAGVLTAEQTASVKALVSGAVRPVAYLNMAKFGPLDARLDLQAAVDYVYSYTSGVGGDLWLDGDYTAIARLSRHASSPCAILVPSRVRIICPRKWAARLRLMDSVPAGTAVFRTADAAEGVEFIYLRVDGNKQRLAAGVRGTAEDEGISLKNAVGGRVVESWIHDCSQDAVDYDGGSAGEILQNLLVDNGGCGVHAVGTSSNGDGMKIIGNTSRGNNIDRMTNSGIDGVIAGISVGGGRRNVIVANNLSNGDARGICIGSITNSSVAGNVVENAGTAGGFTGSGAGILAIESGILNLEISGNTVRGTSTSPGDGISLLAGQGINVSGNNVYICRHSYYLNGAVAPSVTGGQSVGSGNTVAHVRVGTATTGEWSVDGVVGRGGQWGHYIEAGSGTISGGSMQGVSEHGVDIRGAISSVKVLGVNTDAAKYGVRMLSSPTNCTVKGGAHKGATGPIQTTGTGHLLDVECVGTPEAQLHAAIGSRAFRTDGGAATTMYVKESGTGNTGWVAK